jgi:hypothetical protein
VFHTVNALHGFYLESLLDALCTTLDSPTELKQQINAVQAVFSVSDLILFVAIRGIVEEGIDRRGNTSSTHPIK